MSSIKDQQIVSSTDSSRKRHRDERRQDPEVAKLRRNLDAISSKVHDAISSAPEIAKVLAETKRSPFTRRIAAIPLRDQTALRLQFYNKGDDPRGWLRNFEIVMKRQKYASHEEQDANYCQVFIEHMNKDATSWFSNLPAETIDSFDDLSTAFMKHFGMFMSKGSTNLFTMAQGKDEPLREFVERFKTAAAEHSDIPDAIGIKAFENGLWFESKLKESLMLDEPATLQDALHSPKNTSASKKARRTTQRFME
ncbi:unnamed protein product [Microthlaspi erraticum]|uniref:Retrotransposon gag domain-containing protein n=1 Tax=Microthlaspi erraticum TaxID=1685480 RepID=A0A6D2HWL9_9BRAS|nr:unnamed protein product [Microthlaspi erraticum]CAA7029705.1 unnamed protein product [Microthlaspi erraticum]